MNGSFFALTFLVFHQSLAIYFNLFNNGGAVEATTGESRYKCYSTYELVAVTIYEVHYDQVKYIFF